MFQLVKRGLALRRCGARFYRSLSPLPPLRVGIPNAIGEQAIQIGKVRIAVAVEARAFKLADIAGGVGYLLGGEGRCPAITNALPDSLASWNRGLPDIRFINASRSVSLLSV
jgi:hypothetical protein